MNLNFRKTALLAGICSVFSLGYAPQLFAVSSTDTVEAVQQTKKITGVVSDAMGPIIGANVLEKGTTIRISFLYGSGRYHHRFKL